MGLVCCQEYFSCHLAEQLDEMALSSAASMLRSTVLKHLRLHVTNVQQSALPTFTNVISRGFGGGFLDKDTVTERVLHVTKHFEKIDASKARGLFTA